MIVTLSLGIFLMRVSLPGTVSPRDGKLAFQGRCVSSHASCPGYLIPNFCSLFGEMEKTTNKKQKNNTKKPKRELET